MPYAYLADPDLAADFWTIRMVEEDDLSPISTARAKRKSAKIRA